MVHSYLRGPPRPNRQGQCGSVVERLPTVDSGWASLWQATRPYGTGLPGTVDQLPWFLGVSDPSPSNLSGRIKHRSLAALHGGVLRSGCSQHCSQVWLGKAQRETARTWRAVYRRAGEWWSWRESNSRPPACKAGALPTELQPPIRTSV